jgi:transcriptional regulator with XRE-family HTH domain
MAKLKQHFGKKLKILRVQKGMTQEQLANAVDLTVESISNIERGIHGPKFDNLEKLAGILNEEVVVLFEFNS